MPRAERTESRWKWWGSVSHFVWLESRALVQLSDREPLKAFQKSCNMVSLVSKKMTLAE